MRFRSPLQAIFPALLLTASLGASGASDATQPNVLIVSIDTLRADRMSAYGYERETSPHIDGLIARGVNFTQARTVEPLTGPALCSMITSRHPHEHGASRNGLRMREDLESLPVLLRRHGYRSAAFLGNWTLKDKVTGMGDHFDTYETVLKHKRWFGLISGEATADDVSSHALDWLRAHVAERPHQPVLLWVHYVEPHAPYVLHEEYVERLGIDRTSGKKVRAADRYDTEIADVDRAVGELLAAYDEIVGERSTLTVVTADHGESLGEHNYWGHGRHLYDVNLHIPMALAWPGRVEPGSIEAPSLNIDIAPTIAGLLGIEVPLEFGGHDWAPTLIDGAPAPEDRLTHHQAHKGVVLSRHRLRDPASLRPARGRRGLSRDQGSLPGQEGPTPEVRPTARPEGGRRPDPEEGRAESGPAELD